MDNPELYQSNWKPGRRIIAQWTRHVCKVQKHIREFSRKDAPPLSIILRADDVSKYLTVSDGDGFLIAGLRIRLFGMDAPEIDQPCTKADGKEWPCGEKVRWRLFEILSGNEIEVRVVNVDRYGRLLAVCYVNGEDAGGIMVREGLAVCYGSKRYRKEEAEAVKHRHGIWAGAYQTPASWRQTCKKLHDKSNKSDMKTIPQAARYSGPVSGWERLEQGFQELLRKVRSA